MKVLKYIIHHHAINTHITLSYSAERNKSCLLILLNIIPMILRRNFLARVPLCFSFLLHSHEISVNKESTTTACYYLHTRH
ncbi:hypothetical protein FKM82_014144 [Ascaphus truei]